MLFGSYIHLNCLITAIENNTTSRSRLTELVNAMTLKKKIFIAYETMTTMVRNNFIFIIVLPYYV